MTPSSSSPAQPVINWIAHRFRNSRLGRQLLGYVLLFSSLLIVLSSGVQSYLIYRKELAAIQTRLIQIPNNYEGSIANSLWTMDIQQLHLLMQGIREIPHVTQVVIITQAGESYANGNNKGLRRSLVKEFPLRHEGEFLGSLKVVADLDTVIRALWGQALLALFNQLILIYCVSTFFFLMFSNFLTRHLTTMSDYALRLNLEHLDEKLELDRPHSKPGDEDELDQVVNAINAMRLSLRDGLEARTKAEEAVRTLNAKLEQRVEERTSQLAKANEELRIATEAANVANRSKSQFLANMSHELRTPLNSILGFAQVMRKSPRLYSEERNYLDRILRAGEHLLNLINDVLSISKIEAGKVTLSPAPFQLRRMVETIQDLISIKTREKKLEFHITIAEDVPDGLESDEGKLRQVLINLLGNAVKFTRQGSIGLNILRTEDRFRFEVWDTGPGLSAEDQAKLFHSFQQTQTGVESREGTGLGLFISQAIVRLMGGEITIQSELDKGACFAFELPLPFCDVIPSSQTSITVERLSPAHHGLKVLVVDDQQDNRESFAELMTQWGCSVRVASDGQEALAIWEAWRPRIVWMDIQMPGINGLEATGRLRQKEQEDGLARTVVIAFTASALNSDRKSFLEHGFDDFILKPFWESKIVEVMTRLTNVTFDLRPSQTTDTIDLTPASIATLPQAWRTAFHQVLQLGDLNEAKRQLSLLEDNPMHQGLKSLVQSYRMEELLRLFQPPEASK